MFNTTLKALRNLIYGPRIPKRPIANIYNQFTYHLQLKRCSITANGRVLILAVLQYSYSATTILLIVIFITTFCMNS